MPGKHGRTTHEHFYAPLRLTSDSVSFFFFFFGVCFFFFWCVYFFFFFFALFCFCFSCLLLRFGFAIVAPRIIVIDHLLKTFNFFKKEVLGSEKKSV